MIKNNFNDLDIVGTSSSVEKAVGDINRLNPDFVFLDIKLEDGNAFNLLHKFEDDTLNFIFITAYDEFAIKAFEFGAIDYILKPLEEKRLVKTIKKLMELNAPESAKLKLKELITTTQTRKFEKLSIQSHTGIIFIRVDQIILLRSSGNYCKIIHKTDGEFLSSKSLKHFEQLLPQDSFFRVNKSELINLSMIEGSFNLRNDEISLSNGFVVKVSRRKKNTFLDWLRKNT